ncbi:MAG: hypothetical protein LBH18_02840, partial [Spirochaetaceae bacterium]|nr:hypothetical protein [Spirochaetaceae bacterium]
MERKKRLRHSSPHVPESRQTRKSRIFDEYPDLSGSKNRKYAIFKLNRIGKTQLRMMDCQVVRVSIIEKSR